MKAQAAMPGKIGAGSMRRRLPCGVVQPSQKASWGRTRSRRDDPGSSVSWACSPRDCPTGLGGPGRWRWPDRLVCATGSPDLADRFSAMAARRRSSPSASWGSWKAARCASPRHQLQAPTPDRGGQERPLALDRPRARHGGPATFAPTRRSIPNTVLKGAPHPVVAPRTPSIRRAATAPGALKAIHPHDLRRRSGRTRTGLASRRYLSAVGRQSRSRSADGWLAALPLPATGGRLQLRPGGRRDGAAGPHPRSRGPLRGCFRKG